MHNIRQIYYKQEQETGLIFPGEYNPVRSGDWSYLFLESDVIRRLCQQRFYDGHRYSGVLSPAFEEKYKNLIMADIDFFSKRETEFRKPNFLEFLDRSDADIVPLLQCKAHDPIYVAERFHGKNFRAVWDAVMQHFGLGYKSWWCETPMYFNYWVATPEIMQEFGNWMYNFCQYILTTPQVFRLATSNSFYQKRFPLSKEFGIDWWPLLPFLAERLIMAFIIHKNPKVVYY